MDQLIFYGGCGAVTLLCVWMLSRSMRPKEDKPKGGPGLLAYAFVLLLMVAIGAGGYWYGQSTAWADSEDRWEEVVMATSDQTKIWLIQNSCKKKLNTCDWIAKVDNLGGGQQIAQGKW